MHRQDDEMTDGVKAEQLAPLPPIADLVSREIRRMGRAWKVEATKSLLHAVLTVLVVTVLGVGWLMLLAVVSSLVWYAKWRFTLKATVKPYRFLTRSPAGLGEPVAASIEEAEYAEWLVGGSATDER